MNVVLLFGSFTFFFQNVFGWLCDYKEFTYYYSFANQIDPLYCFSTAHKLALHDLGKAIAINPVGADNYYLRGDCHSKLGNYEQVSELKNGL